MAGESLLVTVSVWGSREPADVSHVLDKIAAVPNIPPDRRLETAEGTGKLLRAGAC